MTAEVSLLGSAQTLVDVAAKLGAIDSVKRKLMKQPDVAAMKLAAVLEELMKFLLAFESEVVKFLAITLEPGEQLRNDRIALYSLEGQALWSRMQAARGHCGKIESVYRTYLDPWFQRVSQLDAGERRALRDLFEQLSDSDGMMVDVLDKATWWLGERSRSVLDLYEGGRLAEANAAISQARREILPVRRDLANLMATLQKIEAEFIELGSVA